MLAKCFGLTFYFTKVTKRNEEANEAKNGTYLFVTCDQIMIVTIFGKRYSLNNKKLLLIPLWTKDHFLFYVFFQSRYRSTIVHYYSAHFIHIPYAIKIGKQEKCREDVKTRGERWRKREQKKELRHLRKITTRNELFSASFLTVNNLGCQQLEVKRLKETRRKKSMSFSSMNG